MSGNKKDKLQKHEYLIILTVISFVFADIMLIPTFFGAASSFGHTVYTVVYLVLWFGTAYYLRDSKGWIKFTLFFRWLFIVFWLLELIFAESVTMLKTAINIVFVLMVTVYGGLPQALFTSVWIGIIPVVQCAVATFLYIRIKLKNRGAKYGT